MTKTNLIRRFGPLVVLAVALMGCGGGDDEQATSPGDAPATSPGAGAGAAGDGKILIKNFVYSPIPAQVKLGQSITVTNADSAPHTLTVPGGIDSGNLAEGKSFTFTPAQAGELDYICDIHQYMKGRIVVQ